MATKTMDYKTVLEFIHQIKIAECYIRDPDISEPMKSAPEIPYVDVGGRYRKSGELPDSYQVFASGWTELEGAMITMPEPAFDADLRVLIAARNERALRDLLLSFPREKVGFFYCAGAWMLNAISEILDGYVMPCREGYFATEATFQPIQPHPVMKLGKEDYEIVQTQWSKHVWDEVQESGHSVHACYMDEELCAMCFHWEIAQWRNEVNGLQAVKDFERGYAESVFSSATAEVLDMGRLATCTANLSNNTKFIRMLQRIGYRPFYRVHSYLGMKRGSNCVIAPPETFFSDTRRTYKKDKGIPRSGVESKPIIKGKDPVMSEFRALVSLKGRQERSLFVVEGLTLVGKALNDGLPVERILYTSDLLKDSDGITLLNQAHVEGVAHHQVSGGLMGTTTTTRPIPPVIASVSMSYRSAEDYHLQAGSSLLIVDGIANPDNLGMVLRTADAAGIEGVIIIEKSASPFHKNCVRAARGAVGRIPLLRCDEPEIYLRSLTNTGFNVLGATSNARKELYNLELRIPLAFVVGNESDGMSIPVRDLCTDLVRIPMAPGQSSLNVGVATGILLYEFVRRKMLPG